MLTTTITYDNKKTEKSQSPVYAYFKDFTNKDGLKKTGVKVHAHIPAKEFHEAIQTGRWKTSIQAVREALATHGLNSTPHKNAKEALHAVCFSVDCVSRTAKMTDSEKLLQYNYELQVDLDIHGTLEEVEKEKADLWNRSPYFRSLFVSASGNGLKGSLCFEFETDESITGDNIRSFQKLAFLVCEKYLKSLGITAIDESVKDPFRLCFVSYDTNALYRDNPERLLITLADIAEFSTKSASASASASTANNPENTISGSIASSETSGHKKLDKILASMCETIRNAQSADKGGKGRHATIRDCSFMMGGYIAGTGYDEETAFNALLIASNAVRPESADDNPRVIRESIEAGKAKPAVLEDPLDAFAIAEKLSHGFDEKEMNYFIYGAEKQDAEILRFIRGDVLINVEFEGKHSDLFRYENGKWIRSKIRNGEFFATAFDTIQEIYKEFARYYYEKAEKTISETERKKLEKTAELAMTRGSGRNKNEWKRKVLEAYEDYIISHERFDDRPELILCRNGVFDLEADKFIPHSPDHYLTMGITQTDYNPDAKCPKFDDFMTNMVFDGDKDTACYWWDMMSAGIHGRAVESLVILLGNDSDKKNGTNGKSFGTNIIAEILEDYVGNVDVNVIVDGRQKRGNNRLEAIAKLYKKRFVIGGELHKHTLITSAMKEVVQGEDKLISRILYEGLIEFYLKALIVAYSNNPPKVEDGTESLSKRLDYIPFHHKFPNAERQRRDAWRKLYLSEREGILAKLIEHARKNWNRYLTTPKRVIDLKRKMLQSLTIHNSAEHFIFESGNFIKDPTGTITKKEFRSMYDEWMECQPRNKKYTHFEAEELGSAVKSMGFGEGRPMKNGKRDYIYTGFRKVQRGEGMTSFEDSYEEVADFEENLEDLPPIPAIEPAHSQSEKKMKKDGRTFDHDKKQEVVYTTGDNQMSDEDKAKYIDPIDWNVFREMANDSEELATATDTPDATATLNASETACTPATDTIKTDPEVIPVPAPVPAPSVIPDDDEIASMIAGLATKEIAIDGGTDSQTLPRNGKKVAEGFIGMS